eukprot:328821-Prorocentrum_minimum.AAC.1
MCQRRGCAAADVPESRRAAADRGPRYSGGVRSLLVAAPARAGRRKFGHFREGPRPDCVWSLMVTYGHLRSLMVTFDAFSLLRPAPLRRRRRGSRGGAAKATGRDQK